MKKTDFDKKINDILKKDLNIHYDDFHRSMTLEELDLTVPEINLFLNKVEIILDINIEDQEIDFHMTLMDFVGKIVENSEKD